MTASNDTEVKPDRVTQLEREGDIAADYLEALLDIADLDGDIDMDVEGDRAMVAIVGAKLTQLVGPNGKVLDALQELTRLAVTQQTGDRSRLMLDVAGYRERRRAELVAAVGDLGPHATMDETSTRWVQEQTSSVERVVAAVETESAVGESRTEPATCPPSWPASPMRSATTRTGYARSSGTRTTATSAASRRLPQRPPTKTFAYRVRPRVSVMRTT